MVNLTLSHYSGVCHRSCRSSAASDQTTSLPFRFGTVLSEQAPALRRDLQARAGKSLAHVRGCVEMDLKIIWQRSKPDATSHLKRKTRPGNGFFEKKRRELLGDERRHRTETELSNLLRKELGGLIRDEQIALRPSKTVVLAAVFTSSEGQYPEYQEIVQEIRNNRPDLSIRLSGPWPPYSFANIELEFKTQFGVS